MAARFPLGGDQPLIRTGLRSMLEHGPGLEVVDEADDGEKAVALARRHRPDVVLMDIRMPVLDGIEATRRITHNPDLPAVRVVMLTTFDLDDYLYAGIRAGASGFMLKDARPEDILSAVRVVDAGEALLAPSVTRRLIEEFAYRPEAPASPAPELAALTDREREVLARHTYKGFTGAVDKGASCAELFDQRSRFTGADDLARIDAHLGRIGCVSRDSARTDR